MPLINILAEDALFVFDESYVENFEKFPSLSVSSLITQLPLFEIMCDISDSVVRAILSQMVNEMPHIMHYVSTTLIDA